MKRLIVFDWGNTIMRDFTNLPGPMCDWPHVEWVPGAEEALRYLSQSYKLCIATNAGYSDTIAMRKALNRIGAEVYFNWFFSSKDLNIRKPDPLFFYTIAQTCGFKPSDSVMVGDSYTNDIIGASEAGFTTVLLSGTDGDYPEADYLINTMHELIQLF